ncbi:Pls/PosA family non-ribosomal peptide synthetase [Singulisphaera sp. PoT]|uniref:Pls/PosA family non-ribosomal peptide synthetase n=1 Tax=Singulisphaera sp. PoT TaxID=3411797 RepID=UPI003BF6132E
MGSFAAEMGLRRGRFPHEYLAHSFDRLHLYFEHTADARPSAPALACEGITLSYAGLEARANRLAHFLEVQGVRPGDRVGLLIERSAHAYAGLLAILKSGAVLVPLDISSPADRVAFIAEDAGLTLIISAGGPASSCAGLPCRVLDLDASAAEIAREPEVRLEPRGRDGDAACYIMYTSGTTGRPKGVVVNHLSICNFLDVCRPIYGVSPGDRVYQGMTLAFDFSIEEVWPAFAAGATVVAGPTDHRRVGSGLAAFLVENQVTVLCCVPTLLATIDRDVPTLQTLIVGGEACTEDLVRRWSRPGLRMLNTYGPTESTVTATWGELRPDRPVTIGRPLPTYTVHVLDDDLTPMPTGEAGEICIGGPGVAAGYLNRPDLTRERFIPDPFAEAGDARLYRTGDLGRVTDGGEIEYLGRIDGQVKLRGYRVELGEIEAVLKEDEAVSNALVVLAPGAGESGELVAYVTLRRAEGAGGPRRRLYEALRGRLPAYMIPAYLEILDALPMLASGKADRARLPAPGSPRLTEAGASHTAPATPLEATLAGAWGRLFGQAEVSVEADFFLDLGGHSLSAARLVSDLRREPEFRHLSVADLYDHPTVRRLALRVEAAPVGDALTPPDRGERLRHGDRRVWACGAMQFALVYLTLLVVGSPALLLAREHRLGAPALEVALVAVLSFAVSSLLGAALPVAAKWALVGRFRPGRYPVWGWYYCRWWLVRKLIDLSPLGLLAGSPLFGPYARLLGAKVGKGCHVATSHLLLPDLIEIGDDASLGYGVELEPCLVEDGWLELGSIRIGAGVFVGANSVVMLGSEVGEGARLAEQSLVARGQAIPAGESWAGSPSSLCETDPGLDSIEALPPAPPWTPALLAGFLAGCLLFEMLPGLLLAPGLAILYHDLGDGGHWQGGLAASPIAGLVYVLTTCLAVAAGKRLAMPRARAGTFPSRSQFGLRKWLSDKFMELSLESTNALYATLLTSAWLRLLGARVGPRAEISTVSNIDPDLLVVGAESFVADLAVVGAARYHRGRVILGTTELGTRSFVGNAALVPGAASLPDDSLIGVQSVPPQGPMEPGSSWLGSPALFLPRRQESGPFEEGVTFRPPSRLVACRLAIEVLRILLPPTFMYVGILAVGKAIVAMEDLPAWQQIAALPGVYLASALGLALLSAALKWAVVGRYRPRVEPMWSHFVWRTELITSLYENVPVPMLLHWFTGTPLMRPLLRLFGARIGRRVYMETTYLTEFDLVRVEDDALVSGRVSLQTHLFEDRVMKMSTVTVGPGCTVGPRSVVLYDAEMAAGSKLDALSLVMKGEQLPAEGRWRGIPARPVG